MELEDPTTPQKKAQSPKTLTSSVSIGKILDPNMDNMQVAHDTTAEGMRLQGSGREWKKWGAYLSERAWGTVREDYSESGDAWGYFPFDHAKSRCYRWNEDGLAGFCDKDQEMVLTLGLWNEHDNILKERLFGLSGPEGSHGEDCKELYYYDDCTPTYSYAQMTYKYPHRRFPYEKLRQLNNQAVRKKHEGELELVDILRKDFEDGRYFDVCVEYAKETAEDIVCKITVTNRAKYVDEDDQESVYESEDENNNDENASGSEAEDSEQNDSNTDSDQVQEGNNNESSQGSDSEGAGNTPETEEPKPRSLAYNKDGSATIHVIPQVFYRNKWSWGLGDDAHPKFWAVSRGTVETDTMSDYLGHRQVAFVDQEGEAPSELLLVENETNYQKLFGGVNASSTAKDGINDYIVDGVKDAAQVVSGDHFTEHAGDSGWGISMEEVSGEAMSEAAKDKVGTKVGAHFSKTLAAGESYVVYYRFSVKENMHYEADPRTLEEVVQMRKSEADNYYSIVQNPKLTADEKLVQRQAFAGILWSFQYYHFAVDQWLNGDPGHPPPPESRKQIRNQAWSRFHASDVISMPDKWEYPWFAAWDLAFHVVPLAYLDPQESKHQLVLMLREWYMHSNGQIPAYEWNFGDVNPPVHAWACWRVYSIEKKTTGQGDIMFLKRIFCKLLLNYTWWVNRKDKDGKNLFEGGFLGLDNISVFDRSGPGLPEGDELHQADGTAWMCMYALDMLRIALELAVHDQAFEDSATKFFEHFVFIASAMNGTRVGAAKLEEDHGLWSDHEGFYFDHVKHADGSHTVLKVFSYVGLIPLLAVEIVPRHLLDRLPNFTARMWWLIKHHPGVANAVPNLVASLEDPNQNLMLSIVDKHQLQLILNRMVDSNEFLSEHGVRSLSMFHKENPFHFNHQSVGYEPAESQTGMFGGNSNWRGPIWFPINYLIIEALHRYHFFYQKEVMVKVKLKGIGKVSMDLNELSYELKSRLVSLFINPPTEDDVAVAGTPQSKLTKKQSTNNVLLARSLSHLELSTITEADEEDDDASAAEDGDQVDSSSVVSSASQEPQGRPVFGEDKLFQNDEHFKDHVLFYEYFHGNTGKGLGASHQTGWTALVAKLLQGSGDGVFRF